MKAYLINMHLLVPRSRSSAKIKVKYKGYISQKMAVSGAFVFHKHILFFLDIFRFIFFNSCFRFRRILNFVSDIVKRKEIRRKKPTSFHYFFFICVTGHGDRNVVLTRDNSSGCSLSICYGKCSE